MASRVDIQSNGTLTVPNASTLNVLGATITETSAGVAKLDVRGTGAGWSNSAAVTAPSLYWDGHDYDERVAGLLRLSPAAYGSGNTFEAGPSAPTGYPEPKAWTFAGAGAELLTCGMSGAAATTVLPSGANVTFSVSVWLYAGTLAASLIALGHYDSVSGNKRSWRIGYDQPNDRFRCIVSDDGTNATIELADTLGSPSATTWYNVVMVVDDTDLKLSVDGGAEDTQSYTAGGGTTEWNGRIGPVAVWNGTALTDAERVALATGIRWA